MNINIGPGAFILFIAFLILKLCGVILWSWWWIIAPLWVPVVLVLLIIIATFSIWRG